MRAIQLVDGGAEVAPRSLAYPPTGDPGFVVWLVDAWQAMRQVPQGGLPMGEAVPGLKFALVDLSHGFPIQASDGFTDLLDQAVSGGEGTREFLEHFARFGDLAAYLKTANPNVYQQGPGPGDGQRLTASYNDTSLHVDVELDPNLQPTIVSEIPIVGTATISMELPDPFNVVKLTQLGVQLATLPPGIVVTGTLWSALFQPILGQVQALLQSLFDSWLSLGEIEATSIGATVAETAAEVAGTASETTTDVVVEEVVVADLAIDFSAAVPALAAIGVLVALPFLVGLIAKRMVLHLQVTNATSTDFTWSIPYVDEGGVKVQPASATLPAMDIVVDMFGDQSSSSVMHQADLRLVNTSGYRGIGFVLNLVPAANPDQAFAMVIAIPFFDDNSAWLGDSAGVTDWAGLYRDHGDIGSGATVGFGNAGYSVAFAFDALSGNNDNYHAIARILEL